MLLLHTTRLSYAGAQRGLLLIGCLLLFNFVAAVLLLSSCCAWCTAQQQQQQQHFFLMIQVSPNNENAHEAGSGYCTLHAKAHRGTSLAGKYHAHQGHVSRRDEGVPVSAKCRLASTGYGGKKSKNLVNLDPMDLQ